MKELLAPQPNDESLFGRMMYLRLQAMSLWNDGLPSIDHGAKAGFTHPLDARPFLLSAGMTEEALSTFLDENGQFIEHTTPEFDFETVTQAAFDEILIKRFSVLYDAVNKSLDHGHANGFNQHGLEDHILPMINLGVEYAKRLGMSDREIKIMKLEIFAHDLGQWMSRPLHPLLGHNIMKRMMPELSSEKYAGLWADLRKDTVLHDEGIANRYVAYLKKELQAELGDAYTEEHLYQRMREKFGKRALLLIVLDKTYGLDRRRVTRKQLDKDAFTSDTYTVVSALGVTESTKQETDNSTGKASSHRVISFTPEMPAETYPNVPRASGKHTNDVAISESMHDLHLNHGIPHFFTWMAESWKTGSQRFELEMKSMFALFPEMEKFTLIMNDKSGYPTDGFAMEMVYVVPRGEVENVVDWLRINMATGASKKISYKSLPQLYKEVRKFCLNGLTNNVILNFDSLSRSHYVGDPQPWLQVNFKFNPDVKNQKNGITTIENYIKKLFCPKCDRKQLISG